MAGRLAMRRRFTPGGFCFGLCYAATCKALMVWLSALQALALLTRSAAGNEKPIAARSVFEGLEG
jgi:hypothetical protein